MKLYQFNELENLLISNVFNFMADKFYNLFSTQCVLLIKNKIIKACKAIKLIVINCDENTQFSRCYKNVVNEKQW